MQLGGTVASHLSPSVSLEWFDPSTKADEPFEQRQASEALSGSFVESDEKRVFHFLRIGESCRLRIVVQYDPNVRIRVHEVTSVRLQTPDGEPVELERRVLSNDASTCVTVALVDPSSIPSQRLRDVCPLTGTCDARYVRLDLRIEFVACGDSDQTLEANRVLYCKMVPPKSRLRYRRFVRACRERWKRMPEWIKKTTQGIGCRMKTSVLVVW